MATLRCSPPAPLASETHFLTLEETPTQVLLLRGLMDVNVPKFLSHDLPLFAGIISDLFPGAQKPEVDYSEIKDACAVSCQERGLQLVDVFFEKIIQLYEMTIVRHGLMLVRPHDTCTNNASYDALCIPHKHPSYIPRASCLHGSSAGTARSY